SENSEKNPTNKGGAKTDRRLRALFSQSENSEKNPTDKGGSKRRFREAKIPKRTRPDSSPLGGYGQPQKVNALTAVFPAKS
ncbi:MAG: hypothetical protein LBS62_10965, partial [Clostridiales bacterium]|nr:hypothetical protein [Clostridiales bacterium]